VRRPARGEAPSCAAKLKAARPGAELSAPYCRPGGAIDSLSSPGKPIIGFPNGVTIKPAPKPKVSSLLPSFRAKPFFGGWPIFAYALEEGATKTTQKWDFFRAVQPADKFTGRANYIRGRQISPDVALFFGGGSFLRFPQKWGFFQALQLQTGANSYAAASR
jgi:hypothetical protein